MLSSFLVETVGGLGKDEWGPGLAMGSTDVMLCYLAAPDSSEGVRCKKALEYYSLSLIVLGISSAPVAKCQPRSFCVRR